MLQTNSKSKRNTINRRIKIRISNGKKKRLVKDDSNRFFPSAKMRPKIYAKKITNYHKKNSQS